MPGTRASRCRPPPRQTLRAELAAHPTSRSASADEVLQRVKTLIDQSESRQQRELALRVAQVVNDFDTQRRADLLRVEQNFGQLEGQTGAEVAQQRELLNSLVKVSQGGRTVNAGRACAVVTLASVAAVPLAAQVRPGGSGATTERMQANHEILALEGVLENAVRYGAQMLNQHVQASATPESVLLTGLARARGLPSRRLRRGVRRGVSVHPAQRRLDDARARAARS